MPDSLTSLIAVRWRVLALVALVTTLAGVACDRDEESQSPEAQVLIAIVRDAAAEQPAGDESEDLPVVYVVSATDEGLSAQVQATVANAVNKEVDVRFADARSEALDTERPGSPVRDEGRLVAVGDLTEDVDPRDVFVEIYQSETQFSLRTMTFSSSGEVWSVTSSSVLEEEDVAPTTPSDEDEEGADGDGATHGPGGNEDGGGPATPSAPPVSGP